MHWRSVSMWFSNFESRRKMSATKAILG
jgi:hypothetical protein